MTDFRGEFQRQIVGNIIKDRCSLASANLEWLDYQDGFCSGYSIVRLGTDALDRLSAERGLHKDRQGGGHAVMYAIDNGPDGLRATLAANERILGPERAVQVERWLDAEAACPPLEVLGRDAGSGWVLIAEDQEMDQAAVEEAVDHFLYAVIPDFENGFFAEEPFDGVELHEGACASVLLDRFERNTAARARCLEERGRRCLICGFDFGEFYGEACEGMIEVHHIEPLSSIRKDHVVDPAKDLIPVCPNCHWVLHADSHGVRSPEEVRAMVRKCQRG